MNACLSRAGAAAATLVLMLSAGSAAAGIRVADGVFSNDDDLWSTSFDLVQSDVLTVSSFSYGGDTSRHIAAGGFAPVLTLFQDGVGLLQLAQANAVCAPGAASADPVSGFCWDATLTLVAANAGHYTLVLSQDGNNALGQSLAEGYSRAGEHDYTGLDYLGLAGARFVQVDGTQRTGQ